METSKLEPGLQVSKVVLQEMARAGAPPGGGHWWIIIPAMPAEMNPSDYQNAIENEFRTGDGGDNIS